MLDTDTGTAIERTDQESGWYSEWLEEIYSVRQQADPDVTATVVDGQTVVVLNTIDRIYGHSVSKLMNVQHYLDETDATVVVIVPERIKWLVPDDVDSLWTVDMELGRGAAMWNDTLGAAIREQVAASQNCYLTNGWPTPRPDRVSIEQFSGVAPFSLEDWKTTTPTVTFVPHGDRLWSSSPSDTGTAQLRGYLNRATRMAGVDTVARRQHDRRVRTVAEELRRRFPDIDFGLAGVERSGSSPDWVTDLRTPNPSTETELEFCRRYARSHVVFGPHGSNLLLPSAHAGAAMSLMPAGRWSNMSEDLLLRDERTAGSTDTISSVKRYHFVPQESHPETVARMIAELIETVYPRHQAIQAEWRPDDGG